MHRLRRSDFDEHDEGSNDATCGARSLYRCLHADDFAPSVQVKRHCNHESRTAPALAQLPGVSTIGLASNPSQEREPDHSRRKLQGVSLQLLGLTDTRSYSHELARGRASAVIRSCLEATWETSTIARYNAVLEGAVTETEQSMGLELLPCDSDIKLMLLFARFDGAPWGSVSVAKAAVRAWHLERELGDTFQSAWTQRAFFFWKGLKKRADHTKSAAKRPIHHAELLGYQKARLDAGTVAGMRDAAISAVCFYGIRRSSEALSLEVGDLSVIGDSLKLQVRCQKNDPEGRGMACWLPKIASLGDLCPYHLVTTWLVCRHTHWPQSQTGPLFCVSSSLELKAVSYDSWRKSLLAYFTNDVKSIGTHSLRKGGATWLKYHALMSDEGVQAQGGWATAEVMHQFYARFPEAAQHAALEQAFERFSLQNSR